MQHPQTTPTPPTPRQHRWPQVWGPRFLQLLAFAILITAYRFITVKLSGIGSKAGGPDDLLQFVLPRTITEITMRRGFAPKLAS